MVHGVGMKEVGRIGKAFFRQIEHCPKEEIFGICEELWRSRYLEEAVVACIFSEWLHKRYEPADFRVFEGWVERYVTNWGACDTLCNHTVGTFVTIYPEFPGELKRWAGFAGAADEAGGGDADRTGAEGAVPERYFRDRGYSADGSGRYGAEGLRLDAEGGERGARAGSFRLCGALQGGHAAHGASLCHREDAGRITGRGDKVVRSLLCTEACRRARFGSR